MSEWDPYSGRERCCDEDYGGSHYHCTRCGAVTSMMGHYSKDECEDSISLGHDRPEWLEENGYEAKL